LPAEVGPSSVERRNQQQVNRRGKRLPQKEQQQRSGRKREGAQ
jgi:hypothetical protein